jgi:Predicted 3'-5' exonuclease related to the exonuclease domain of PolB
MDATILDLECCAIDNVLEYYDDSEPITAPANYVKAEAIAAYIERETPRRRQAFVERAALDPDLCRIVYAGVWYPTQDAPCMWPCRDEQDEAAALRLIWDNYQPGEVLGGFGIRAYDLPVLYRRSLYLGVTPKHIDRDRYRSTCVLDLFELLNEGRKNQMHSLTWYCERFGVPCDIEDLIDGKDVPACVARGEWDLVRAHLLADLVRTRGLARRVCGD